MNLKAAVVEDEEGAGRTLADMINRYAAERGHVADVEVFSDGYSFLAHYGSDFDVIFLDIDMPGMDGMEVARNIRKTDDNAILVFVTNMAQYAVEGYSVRAMDFVLKPVTYSGFLLKFDRICKELQHNIEERIKLANRSETRNVRVADILYVEASNHDLIYHLFEGEFRVRGTIAGAEERLAPRHFARCNSCYLVNLRYADGIRGDWVIVRGKELRMSRSRKAAFMRELARYAGGSV